MDPSPQVHVALFNIALSSGRFDEMVQHAVRVAEISQARGETMWLAHGLAGAALGRALAGDAAGASADAEAALAAARQLANPYAVQMAMAGAAFGLGNADPVRALTIAREIVAFDPRRRTSLPLAIAGDLAARNGEKVEALEYMAAALGIMQWQRIIWGVGSVLVRVGTILADRDPEAATLLDGAGEALTPGFTHHAETTADRERAVEMTTASLGPARRADLYAEGLAMSADEAVSCALGAIDRYLEAESEE